VFHLFFAGSVDAHHFILRILINQQFSFWRTWNGRSVWLHMQFTPVCKQTILRMGSYVYVFTRFSCLMLVLFQDHYILHRKPVWWPIPLIHWLCRVGSSKFQLAMQVHCSHAAYNAP